MKRLVTVITGITVMLLAGVAPTLAAASEHQVLRSAPNHVVFPRTVASHGDDIAVGWGEAKSLGAGSGATYLRWSRDAGVTFEPTVEIGKRSIQSIDICAGRVWVLSNDDESSYLDARIDGWALDGSGRVTHEINVDVSDDYLACVGENKLAAVWSQYITGRHADIDLRMWPIDDDGTLGEELQTDVGRVRPGQHFTMSLAATPHAIHVAWTSNAERPKAAILYEQFTVLNTKIPALNPHSRVTVARGQEAGYPSIGANGHRVAIAYAGSSDTDFRLQTNMRVSTDGGSSFGPARLVGSGPHGAQILPLEVSLHDSRVLVEGVAVGGFSIYGRSLMSGDDGVSWSRVSGHGVGAVQYGTLVGSDQAAEAWGYIDGTHLGDLYFHLVGT